MSRSGADIVVESLVSAGIPRLFSLSGNQILPLYNATIDHPIEIIHTRHEAAAVHMADAWGRLTEQPGVALLTAGPGHCNAISALYVALMSESPVVLISGHCALNHAGMGGFQEIDQVATARPVTKAAWLVDEPNRLRNHVTRALSLACEGRPGPVYLSLPNDILEMSIGAHQSTMEMPSNPHGTMDDMVIEAILERVKSAKKPLILTGSAMSRTHRWREVKHLSEITGIPALPLESPRGVNDPWLHGATNCLSDADLILLVGKKLDFTLKFGQLPFFDERCQFIQIDADKEALSQDERAIQQVHADPLRTIRQLSGAAQAITWPQSAWQAEVIIARQQVPSEWYQIKQQKHSGNGIHPLSVCEALQPYLDDGGVLISDGGEFGQWAQAGLDASVRLINGPAGAIGGSVPMGITAKQVHGDRHVFVTVGDGAFGYHAMELDTALRYDLPVIVIVGNDARWNAEHQLLLKNYERSVACDLLPTRYDMMIAALGGHGEHVQNVDELAPALQRAVASGKPACINVDIEGVAAPVFR